MTAPTLNHSQRLHWTVAQQCPIDGVSIGTPGNSATCRFHPAAQATQAQITAGQNALNTYDWSDANLAAWQRQQARGTAQANLSDPGPDHELLRAVLYALVDEFNTILNYLGKPAITAGQLLTAVQNKLSSGAADN
jgi:hypothetical protein